MTEKSDKYVLCIDGGASNSLGAAITLQGEIVATGDSGPIAAVDTEKSLMSNLGTLVDSTLQNGKVAITNCLNVAIGIASSPYVLTDRVKGIVERVFRNLDFRASLLIKTDMETTWAGATACQPGVVVYGGTGSFAYGVNEGGNCAHVDPMGSLLGDEGSAYFIGIQALKGVVRSLDGRGNKTLLKEKIFEEFSMNYPTEFFSKNWRSLPRKRIAELSLLVDKCAGGGDLVAQEILRDAGCRLAKYTSAVIDRLDCETCPVYYAGGVFKSQVVLDSFTQHLTDEYNVKIQKNKYGPIIGAFLLSCERLPIDISKQVLTRLFADKYKLQKMIKYKSKGL